MVHITNPYCWCHSKRKNGSVRESIVWYDNGKYLKRLVLRHSAQTTSGAMSDNTHRSIAIVHRINPSLIKCIKIKIIAGCLKLNWNNQFTFWGLTKNAQILNSCFLSSPPARPFTSNFGGGGNSEVFPKNWSAYGIFVQSLFFRLIVVWISRGLQIIRFFFKSALCYFLDRCNFLYRMPGKGKVDDIWLCLSCCLV